MHRSSLKYLKRAKNLLTSSIFWSITLIGNLCVFIWASAFHQAELVANDQVNTYLDSIWWAFATITTVGYGDITPVTVVGKILGISLMLVGTAFFATYTALFANALLGKEISKIEDKVEDMQHVEHELEKTLRRLDSKLKSLEKKL